MSAGRLAATLAVLAMTAMACGRSTLPPAPLDTRNETCRSCRMAVSDARFAAQIVAPGEEPVFFDDVGCLGAYLARSARRPDAVVYLADHRTKSWIAASRAVITRVPGLETPMNSHLVAHADAASRDADPDARGGQDVAIAAVLGKPAVPPDSERAPEAGR
jgi:copper chaperone NosL